METSTHPNTGTLLRLYDCSANCNPMTCTDLTAGVALKNEGKWIPQVGHETSYVREMKSPSKVGHSRDVSRKRCTVPNYGYVTSWQLEKPFVIALLICHWGFHRPKAFHSSTKREPIHSPFYKCLWIIVTLPRKLDSINEKQFGFAFYSNPFLPVQNDITKSLRSVPLDGQVMNRKTQPFIYVSLTFLSI